VARFAKRVYVYFTLRDKALHSGTFVWLYRASEEAVALSRCSLFSARRLPTLPAICALKNTAFEGAHV
jgi:hypothetical protein